jgi:hypothetical protein
VNVSPRQVRIAYRLPKDHETYGRATARDNTYGIALSFRSLADVDLAMRLLDDTVAGDA